MIRLPCSSSWFAFSASDMPTITNGASTTSAMTRVTISAAGVTLLRVKRCRWTNTGQVVQQRMIAHSTALRNGCSTR